MPTPHIYIDADACPVKEEVYKVAQRYDLHTTLVTNAAMRVPESDLITLELVGQGFDEADDWIVEHAQPYDIVITTDIPLAARCLEKGAYALGPKGRVFTQAAIGDALATRELMASMRDHGAMTGGPAPFQPKDRSRFLQALDKLIHQARKQP